MNKQILLIDDDVDEQVIFKEALKVAKLPVNCLFANNATQGIELLNNIEPDFIFLDINMPGMNGLQCLNVIKKKDSLKHIPVIMYSTSADEEITKSAIALGAFNWIIKKGSVNDLAVTLTQIVRVQ